MAKIDGTNLVDDERAWLLKVMAERAHADWSKWMMHVFSQCLEIYDGALVIPAPKVARWARQMSTPFHALGEDEQKSDYEIAEQYKQIFDEYQEHLTLRDSPPIEIAATDRCQWCAHSLDYSERFRSQPFDLTLCERCFNERRTFMNEWHNIHPFGDLEE